MRLREYIFYLVFLLILLNSSVALADNCRYQDQNGIYRIASDIGSIPKQFREGASCKANTSRVSASPGKSSDSKNIAKSAKSPAVITVNDYVNFQRQSADRNITPDEVKLKGQERYSTIPSSLGDIKIRWLRSVESYFGKNPDRAIKTAWHAASRALAQNSFPANLRSLSYGWNVVFMDNVPARADIHMQGCHPAWMRPPADIFVASRRLASSCGDSLMPTYKASVQLSETLLHELGHAVEFRLLGNGFGHMQRWHNEGFATWFQSLGASYLFGGETNSRSALRKRAKKAYSPNWRPRMFRGTFEDYARAYSLIAVIAEKRSILRLVEVYKRMGRDQISFLDAVRKELGWDEDKLLKMAAANLGIR